MKSPGGHRLFPRSSDKGPLFNVYIFTPSSNAVRAEAGVDLYAQLLSSLPGLRPHEGRDYGQPGLDARELLI